MTFSTLHLWTQNTGENSNFLFCHTFKEQGALERFLLVLGINVSPPNPHFFPFFLLIGNFSSPKITFAYFWLCYQVG